MSEFNTGDVVFMKASSGLCGCGNAQCISSVCKPLGEISLYGHNQHYKTYDIARVAKQDPMQAAARDMYEALKAISQEAWLMEKMDARCECLITEAIAKAESN